MAVIPILMRAVLLTSLIATLKTTTTNAQEVTTEEPGWLVIGGSFAQKHEFPWMVRIYSDIPNTDTFSCGATMITESWLITAGHCVNNGINMANSVRAYFGKHDLSIYREPGEQYRSIAKEDIYVHPNFYAGANTDFDFALLHLKNPVLSSSTIYPISLPDDTICLPNADYNDETEVVDSCTVGTAAGWGRPGPADYMTFILKKVDLTLTEFSPCGQIFAKDYFTAAKICARGRPGQQTCRGDSGGPLMCKIDKRQYLIGVTSYGNINCNDTTGSKPAVYSRVCAAMPWIRTTLAAWNEKAVYVGQAPAATVPSFSLRIRTRATTAETAWTPFPLAPVVVPATRSNAEPVFIESQTTSATTVTTSTTRPPPIWWATAAASTWSPSQAPPPNNRNDLDYPPALPVSAGVYNSNNARPKNSYFFYPPAASNCSDPNYVILQTLRRTSECPLLLVADDVKQAAFFNAIRGSFPEVVRSLLYAGVDPNSVENYADYGYSQPAIILAARWDRLEIIAILLDLGAIVDDRDSLYGRTAINWAVCDRKPRIVSYLLQRGASTIDCKCADDSCSKYFVSPAVMSASVEGGSNGDSQSSRNSQNKNQQSSSSNQQILSNANRTYHPKIIDLLTLITLVTCLAF